MKVVILAGGKGTRLKPYSTVFPKPLMPIGDRPILEIIIRQLQLCNLKDIIICTGHLSKLIETFFGDGVRFGVNITYSNEDLPLGTVGGLSLIQQYLKETFLMVNGDTLTKLNFSDLVAYHNDHGAIATIALNKRNTYIDFGVVELGGNNNVSQYIEKPTIGHLVSMGVNVFEPRILEHIKPGERLDFPDLIKTLISKGDAVKGYEFAGYWLDIGRPDDYEKANDEFETIFQELHEK